MKFFMTNLISWNKINIRCVPQKSVYKWFSVIHNNNEKPLKFEMRQIVKFFDVNFAKDENTPLVTMKTYAKPSNKQPIFAFPGFEGYARTIEVLIANLDRTVHAFQYPLEDAPEDTRILSKLSASIIANNSEANQQINIFGHSFGGCSAIGAAQILEEQGRQIRLCFTDFSPHAMSLMNVISFGDAKKDLNGYENNVLLKILAVLEVSNLEEIEEKIRTLNWNQKVHTILSMIPDNRSIPKSKLKFMFTNIRNRIHSSITNDQTIKLKNTKVTLIRSAINVLPFPDDYELQKHFENPVDTYMTDGHHMNMLKYQKTAELIKQCFDN